MGRAKLTPGSKHEPRTLAIKIPYELWVLLQRAAEEDDRTISSLVRRLVKIGLQRRTTAKVVVRRKGGGAE